MQITITSIAIWIVYVLSLFFLTFWLLTFLEKGLKDKKQKLDSFPKVTVSVPAYNEEEGLAETVNSILALDYPRDKVEIIIVNDCSKDNTRKVAEQLKKDNANRDIKIINHKTNLGKGRGMNNALKLANGEFFVCLDADSVIQPNALKKMVPVFKDKKVSTVLPLMKVKNPKGMLGKLQWCEYLINLFYKGIMGKVDCIHVSPGPFSIYRKEALDKVGGFDENNLTEDLEITLRMQKANYKIVQLLNTVVYTRVPLTWKGFYKQRNRWYKGTMINMFGYKDLLLNKKYGDFGIIQMPKILLSGFIAVFVFFLILYHLIRPLFMWIYNSTFVNFNLDVMIANFYNTITNFNLLDLNYTNIIFGATSIILALIILKLAFKYTQERYSNQGWLSVPAYLILYGIIASGIWLGVFIDLIFRRIQKW